MNLLFPKKCACCGSRLYDESTIFSQSSQNLPSSLICGSCAARLPKIKAPYCPSCGRGREKCSCRERAFAFDAVVSPFYYEGVIKDAVARMKFGKSEGAAVFLGHELGLEIAARLFGVHFDILSCVPASAEAAAARGFNQSEEIALNLRLPERGFHGFIKDFRLLKKDKNTAVQHYLDAAQRFKNIENAYSLNKNREIYGKTVLLVDDIMTTGATADSCARALKFAGASRVILAAAALTVFHEDEGEAAEETAKFI